MNPITATTTCFCLIKCKILSVITSVGAVSNRSYPAIPKSYDIKSKKAQIHFNLILS